MDKKWHSKRDKLETHIVLALRDVSTAKFYQDEAELQAAKAAVKKAVDDFNAHHSDMLMEMIN